MSAKLRRGTQRIAYAFENLILISFFHENPVLSILKFLSFCIFSPPLLATTSRKLRMLLISWWICPLLLGKTSHSSLPFCSPKSPAFCMHALSALCKAKVDIAAFPSWPSPPTITVFPRFPALGWEHIASREFSRGPLRMLSSDTVKLKFIQERKERETTALLMPTVVYNAAGAEELVSGVPLLSACLSFKVFQSKPGFSHSTSSPS